MSNVTSSPAFRQRLEAGEALLGIFVKSASYQQVEVLGRTGLDFVVFDAEHAPFDRSALDVCLLAAEARSLPALVRLPNDDPDSIFGVLDMGATGFLAPHVDSAAKAVGLVASARFRGGHRGISPSGRAGSYGGFGLAEYIETQDAATTVMCQIEDEGGVKNVAAIAAVEGVDCLFIGRADLAVSLGADGTDDPVVAEAVETICAAGRKTGVPVGMFLPTLDGIDRHRELGVTLFVIGSDQSLLKAGARRLVDGFGRAAS